MTRNRKFPSKHDYKTFRAYEDVFCGDGVPYYHKTQRYLGKDELARLAELGVKLKFSRFSPLERAQLKRNWMSFADQHNIALSECENFVAGSRHLSDEQRRLKRKSLLPHLGRGLEHRSGGQLGSLARQWLTEERSPEWFEATTTQSGPSGAGQPGLRTTEVEVPHHVYRRNFFTVDFDVALLTEAAKKKVNNLTWDDIGRKIGVSARTAALRYSILGQSRRSLLDLSNQVIDAVVALLPNGRQLAEKRQLWRVQRTDVDWAAVAERVNNNNVSNQKPGRFAELCRNEVFRRSSLHEPQFALERSQLFKHVIQLVHIRCIRQQRHQFPTDVNFSAVKRLACRRYPFMRCRPNDRYYSENWQKIRQHSFHRKLENCEVNAMMTLPKMLKFIRRQVHQNVVLCCVRSPLTTTADRRAIETDTLDLARCQQLVKRRLQRDLDMYCKPTRQSDS